MFNTLQRVIRRRFNLNCMLLTLSDIQKGRKGYYTKLFSAVWEQKF